MNVLHTYKHLVGYTMILLVSLTSLVGLYLLSSLVLWHSFAKNYYIEATDTLLVNRNVLTKEFKEFYVNDSWYDIVEIISVQEGALTVIAYKDKIENHIFLNLASIFKHEDKSDFYIAKLIKLWQTPFLLPAFTALIGFIFSNGISHNHTYALNHGLIFLLPHSLPPKCEVNI